MVGNLTHDGFRLVVSFGESVKTLGIERLALTPAIEAIVYGMFWFVVNDGMMGVWED